MFTETNTNVPGQNFSSFDFLNYSTVTTPIKRPPFWAFICSLSYQIFKIKY